MKNNTITPTRWLLAAVMMTALACTTSCLRDDDLETLRHPIHIQGQIDPHYGIPIAYGEMNFNDLITRLAKENEDVNSYLDSSEVLTLVYSATTEDVIYPFSHSSKAPKRVKTPRVPAGRKAITLPSVDTVFSDTIPIDLFDNADMQSLIDDSIEVTNVWIRVAINAQGKYASPTVESAFNPYVSATYDSLSVIYTGHDGRVDTLQSDALNVAPIEIDDITKGIFHQFDSVNVAEIINSYPSQVIVRFRLKLNIDPAILDTSALALLSFVQVMDSLQLTEFRYTVDADLAVPFSLKVPRLHFTYDLDLGDGLSEFNLDSIVKEFNDSINVDIDDLKLRLAFDNGIPFDFGVQAAFLDADSAVLTTLDLDVDSIAAADLSASPVDGAYTAASPQRTVITASIGNDQIDIMHHARFLRLKMRLRTAQGKHVTVKRNDFLRVKAYMQVHPNAQFDIPLTDEGLL